MRVALFLFLIFTINVNAQKTLNVMSFNVRVNVKSDGEDDWNHRKQIAAQQIKFYDTDIAGLQEATLEHLTDLTTYLPDYKYAGVARDDGKQKGEYSCILYNTKRLELLETETFWLSENINDTGSKGWDASYPRVLTWAKFKDKKTKKKFYFFNTHFDHQGETARRESSKLLLRKVNEVAGNNQVIITGDFNATPEDEPIKIITDSTNTLHLTDTKNISEEPHYGPDETFTGFKFQQENNKLLDYIFIKDKIKVLKHATLSEIWGVHFTSDHFPVFAKLELQ